jgi:hypothetical protein
MVPNVDPVQNTTPNPNTVWNVDPNQTVANQITGLLSSSNPYITNARAQGTQGAASRGFLNGSMAAGASENAAVNAALPIATQDASTYAKAGESNASNATQQAIEAERARAQLGAAGISAGASMFGATTGANAAMFGDTTRAQTSADILAQNAQQYNANWAQQQAQRGWSVEDQNRAEQYATRNAITGTMLGTYANDPSSYMASRDGGVGAMNFYNTNFSNLFGSNSTNAAPTDTSVPAGYGNIPIPNYGP